jgi:predicted Zn-dependent protease
MNIKAGIAILITALTASCATTPTGRHQLLLVPEEQAIVASKQAYADTLSPFAKQGKLDNDAKLKARITRITARLIAQAIKIRPETKDWDWSIKVIDDPEVVNAWCMAGGKRAIYTGLIRQIDPTDDEIAQVMGHEIAHALAKHQAEKMSVALASSLGVLAAGVVSDRPGVTMAGAAVAAKVAIELPNSRTAEAEADRIGIELAAKAGYDPRAAITLWDKMGRLSNKSPPQFLSTHPAPENRQRELARLVPQMMPYYKRKGERPVYPLKP